MNARETDKRNAFMEGAITLRIQTGNLFKQYGRVRALKGVTLGVERGQIFGLLGQNGAGKTTLVKILLGITRATEGSAQLLGEPVGSVPVRKRVGPPERVEGGSDEQAIALRDAMRVLFPEAVALVSAARQGFMREHP